MKNTLRNTLLMGVLAVVAQASMAQAPYVNTTIQGALAPNVYGRIDIGNAPPPPLLYPQPVIIQRSPTVVQQQPLYLHVPPGHAKKWSKHCGKYNACNQPVYFVKVDGERDDYYRSNVRQIDGRNEFYDGKSNAKDHGKDKDHGKEKHHGKGKKHDD